MMIALLDCGRVTSAGLEPAQGEADPCLYVALSDLVNLLTSSESDSVTLLCQSPGVHQVNASTRNQTYQLWVG